MIRTCCWPFQGKYLSWFTTQRIGGNPPSPSPSAAHTPPHLWTALENSFLPTLPTSFFGWPTLYKARNGMPRCSWVDPPRSRRRLQNRLVMAVFRWRTGDAGWTVGVSRGLIKAITQLPGQEAELAHFSACQRVLYGLLRPWWLESTLKDYDKSVRVPQLSLRLVGSSFLVWQYLSLFVLCNIVEEASRKNRNRCAILPFHGHIFTDIITNAFCDNF